MENKPKFLYHYTNIDSAISIIKSGTWRLYEARSQRDPLEIIYAGDRVFELLNYLHNQENIYSLEQRASMYGCLLFVSKYFCESNSQNVINFQDELNKKSNDNIFKQINQLLESKVSKLFISCFSEMNNNLHLWDNYAENGLGVVLQLKSDNLPSNVGVKRVIYCNEELTKDIVSICTSNALSLNNENIKDILINLMSRITDLVSRIKNEQHKNEEETRIVNLYDSELNSNKIIKIDNREFVNFPLRKPQLLKRIKKVYYTDKVEQNKLSELITLLKKHSINSELINI